MTLTDFLLARIAEDEAAAQAAEPGVWKLWGMQVMADTSGTSNADLATPVASCSTPSTTERLLHTGNASHIARHDPARVLADCEAKRRIVELEPDCAFDRFQRVAWDDLHETALRALALPYADHPDYREGWRP